VNVMQTTCPSCHAVFRVRPEQLEAHAGKVRCGKCAYVFNAFETLIQPIETVSFMAPMEEEEAPPASVSANVEVEETEVAQEHSGETVHTYEVRPVTITEAVSGSFPLQTDEQLAREAEEINRVIAATSHPDLAEEAEAREARKTKSGLKITPELQAKLSDLQEQLNKQEKSRRGSSLLWGSGITLLILLLLGQALYQYRDWVAAYYPPAQPLLVSLCDRIGCKIKLLENLSLIKLEGHELQALPERPQLVVFSALLRNNATYRQAYPLIELTLTDNANQPLARRHFSPKDYLPTTTKVDAGLPPQEEVSVKISLDLDNIDAVGYKPRVVYH